MFSTRLDRLGDIEANIREDVLGNLAVGVNPAKTTIYLQSQVPEPAGSSCISRCSSPWRGRSGSRP